MKLDTLRWRQWLFYGLYAAQIVAIVLVWIDTNAIFLEQTGGTALIAYARLWGLLGGWFLLTQLILISGASFIERNFGLDRLARIHHINGFVGYFFVIAHVLFMLTGYAALSGSGFREQYFDLLNTLPYLNLATISLLLLDVVIITSIVIVRKRLRYEYWYFIHLSVYAAVLLALFHQITNGQNLAIQEWFRAYWLGLYVLAFGLVLWRRWLLPVWLHIWHGFKVEKVVKENDNVTSVYIRGKRMNEFQYQAGQFNLWQFLQKDMLDMHHPFTISSSPQDPYLRISAKAIGDFTNKLPHVRPGTTVLISGPYGIFGKPRTDKKRLFIAGGIGITPIRSMLGQQVRRSDVLLYAAQSQKDLVFRADFGKMKTSGLKAYYILSEENRKGYANGYISANFIEANVPDIADREVWLCGPPVMMSAAKKALLELGVEKDLIHTEEFRL